MQALWWFRTKWLWEMEREEEVEGWWGRKVFKYVPVASAESEITI
jgi:hypothetical protein